MLEHCRRWRKELKRSLSDAPQKVYVVWLSSRQQTTLYVGLRPLEQPFHPWELWDTKGKC